MAEEEPRVQKVLAYLEKVKEHGLVRPKTIGEAIGESAQTVGKDLHDLKERGLAVAEEEVQREITPEGRETLETSEPKSSRKKPETERKTETTENLPPRLTFSEL